MPDDSWRDAHQRVFYRTFMSLGRATLTLGDDSGPVQHWQLEGYAGEVRDKVHRFGEFGVSSMPLPGAKVHVSWDAGHRGFGTVIGVEDPRYRPKGLKGGEFLLYVVTGAGAD